MRIGVFDSGLGGLTVAKSIMQRVHGAHIVYIADTAHAPYGEKSPEEIRRFSECIVDTLVGRFEADAVVVACNTATTAAIEALRSRYADLPIIGTEPGIKPAAKTSRSGKVGVLATPATLQSGKYRTLSQNVGTAYGVEIVHQACPGLVEAIEAGKIDHPGTERMLAQWLEPMRNKDVDTIVLGCTHYPLIAPLVRRLMPELHDLIDTGDAIARRLVSLLGEGNRHKKTTLELYATGSFNTRAAAHILPHLPSVKALYL